MWLKYSHYGGESRAGGPEHRFVSRCLVGPRTAGLQGRADHARQDRGSSLGTLPPFAAETVKALCRRQNHHVHFR